MNLELLREVHFSNNNMNKVQNNYHVTQNKDVKNNLIKCKHKKREDIFVQLKIKLNKKKMKIENLMNSNLHRAEFLLSDFDLIDLKDSLEVVHLKINAKVR